MENNTITGFDLNVTEKAVKQFLKIMEDNGITGNYFLRITVDGDKLSGFTYQLGFDSQSRDTDIVLTYPGLKLLIDPESTSFLSGSVIDYNEEGCCGGFVFNNPNAVNKCGCRN